MAEPWERLPFAEQIAYLAEKVNVPTDSYRDVSGAEHDAAFVVAGAKGAVLNDFRGAVDRAIATGQTLEQFRQEFDSIVERTGWTFRGGSAWRANVIWDTNLRTSYAAGRHEQMQQVTTSRPYWQWRHGGSAHPRPQHLALDGKVFRHDDPFWSSFGSPPSGYGCFPDGTEVLTAKGWRSIEKVCVGDLVMTGSGDFQPVIATHPRHYSGQLTRLGIGKERYLTSTPDHRLLTLRGWVKAGNIQPGDVLVQIPQVAAFDESVGNIEQPNALGADGGVALPTQSPLTAKGFQSDFQSGQVDIHPVRRKALVMNAVQPMTSQEVNQPLFGLGGDGLGIGVLIGEVFVFDLPDSRLLSPDLWPSGGGRNPELFSSHPDSLAILLGLAKPGMGLPLPVPRLMPPVGGLHDASVGVAFPLPPNGLTAADGQAVVFQEPDDGSVVHAPSLAELPSSQALLDVEEPEGFVWGHPLGLFDSLEDFVAWARPHCRLSKVDSTHALLYTDNVYNLSVLGHESYCLRDVVAHNCRCSLFTLSDRDLERRGLAAEPGPQLGDRLPIPDLPGQTTAMNPPAGWGHLHGSSGPEHRAQLLDAVTRRLDPAIAAQVRAEAAARGIALVPPKPENWKGAPVVVLEEENRLRPQRFESAAVYTQDGQRILFKDGEQYKVFFTAAEVAQMKDSILTHNHPMGWGYAETDLRHKGNSFSLDDWRMASGANLAQMRAVSPGYRHLVDRPPAGWPLKSRIDRLVKSADNEVKARFSGEIREGTRSVESANAEHWHEVSQIVARKIGANYEREQYSAEPWLQ